MGHIEDKGIYADKLTFQGSPDNVTWTDLFTADENIHEGWNYYQWNTEPRFRFYRLYSNQN